MLRPFAKLELLEDDNDRESLCIHCHHANFLLYYMGPDRAPDEKVEVRCSFCGNRAHIWREATD